MSETVEQTVRRVGNRIVISTIKKEDMGPETVSQSGVINTATDTVTASMGLNWGEISWFHLFGRSVVRSFSLKKTSYGQLLEFSGWPLDLETRS